MGDGFLQSPLPEAITSEGKSSQGTVCSPIGSPVAEWKGQSSGHSPAAVQMGQHMETISGPGALWSEVDCFLGSEPLKNRLAALTCERCLVLDWCIDSLSLFTKHTQQHWLSSPNCAKEP
ncbi:unnamed protein product [Pleuronectes platessa]|uniref:Uncharacterized protein n=1 Tax=Pleuronectes platessa TaxID=8262 RepID=A0A9N7ZEC4_PLEPL|nr:unnamed protein product [Pleuronectes platessa]